MNKKTVLALVVMLTTTIACSSEDYTVVPPQPQEPGWCPDSANILSTLAGYPPAYPDTPVTTSIAFCTSTNDHWTHYQCAICRDVAGNLTLLPGNTRCKQDTARVLGAASIAPDVVCVVTCQDPDCTP